MQTYLTWCYSDVIWRNILLQYSFTVVRWPVQPTFNMKNLCLCPCGSCVCREMDDKLNMMMMTTWRLSTLKTLVGLGSESHLFVFVDVSSGWCISKLVAVYVPLWPLADRLCFLINVVDLGLVEFVQTSVDYTKLLSFLHANMEPVCVLPATHNTSHDIAVLIVIYWYWLLYACVLLFVLSYVYHFIYNWYYCLQFVEPLTSIQTSEHSICLLCQYWLSVLG